MAENDNSNSEDSMEKAMDDILEEVNNPNKTPNATSDKNETHDGIDIMPSIDQTLIAALPKK